MIAQAVPSTRLPRFSIVVISFNQEAFVGEAVSSILASTFPDLEVICVDDGSTDGTIAAINLVAKEDPRVRVIQAPHSGRPSVVRNLGLDLSRGEYVCFLDGDDLSSVDRFTLLDTAIVATHAQVLFGDYVDFQAGANPHEGRRRIKNSPEDIKLRRITGVKILQVQGITLVELPPDPLVGLLLADSFLINTDTICIERRILVERRLTFSPDRTVGEDNLFWLQCVMDSSVTYVDRVFAYWRKRSGSLTATRTPSSQRELVSSMQRQLDLAEGRISATDRAGARRRIRAEAFEVGWILERDGQLVRALLEYAGAAVRFRSWRSAWAAVKAPIRSWRRGRSGR